MKKWIMAVMMAMFAVSATADVTPTAQKWIDGNWLTVERYGDPNDAVGAQAKAEVLAQQAAYTAAKKINDVDGMVKNALTTSAAGWAYQNAGYRLILKIAQPAVGDPYSQESLDKATAAKEWLQKAIDYVNAAPTEGITDAQKKGRSDVLKMADKNMLYARRVLGEIPWPKEDKNHE